MKKQKISNFLYAFFFLLFFSVTYFSIPKLLNFSLESIKEKLKNNNNINIINISKVNYKVFPTPRLSIPNSNFTIGDGVFEVNNSELEIILNISQILNFKEVKYKKLLIKKGVSRISLNNINQVFAMITENKKKLTFKENNLIFLQKDNFFFEINDVQINTKEIGKKKELILNGSFLNNEILIKLDSALGNKNNLILKIPGLDISVKVFLKKKDSDNTNGVINLEVLNNFLKFNFIKKDNVKLSKGFIRTKLVNASLKGEVTFKPNFFIKVDFETSNLNIKKLFLLIENFFLSNNDRNLSLIKKINGQFNFKSKIEGRITNKNGEVLFKDFKVGKNKSIYLNGKINEFGKRGKIQFNLVKTFKYRNKLSKKKIEIIGFMIPSNSKIVFESISIDGSKISPKKTKDYQKQFQSDLIQGTLANIFNEIKINRFLRSLL
jgi:hypothetical protein